MNNAYLLQITTALLISKQDSFLYYKLRQSSCNFRQVLQITRKLLQITTAVTNYNNLFLQIMTIIRQNNLNTC